jgi:hypothetical protein
MCRIGRTGVILRLCIAEVPVITAVAEIGGSIDKYKPVGIVALPVFIDAKRG